MIIREAQKSDVAAIYQLICLLEECTFHFETFKQIAETNIEEANNHYFVAQVDDELVGFISIHVQLLLHHCGKVGEIQELIIKEAYRNQKIGEALLNTAKELAKIENFERLEVTTNIRRTKAHQFYRNNNFIETSKKFVIYKESWQ